MTCRSFCRPYSDNDVETPKISKHFRLRRSHRWHTLKTSHVRPRPLRSGALQNRLAPSIILLHRELPQRDREHVAPLQSKPATPHAQRLALTAHADPVAALDDALAQAAASAPVDADGVQHADRGAAAAVADVRSAHRGAARSPPRLRRLQARRAQPRPRQRVHAWRRHHGA